ncbi:hypothetical protein CGZ93_05050 [Enemella dayhoffiae]|uniref:Uncharacterized protein n=1 Tax=Enemella dayhoffiae TaxID=2016507 RepID=A0A255H8B0_9ACTN|nr:hypothetical protein [Enemella dayhoffiae]OYO23888.1 hypothetical protein CGZ93_05050 [Enemella dayhoffiae]
MPPSFELFETWLEDMDAKLTGFRMAGLPQEWSAKHYTRDALVELQDVVRDWLTSPEQVTDGSEVGFVDGAIRYVGETLIRQIGGRWIFRGRPYLVLDVPGVSEDDPIDVRGVLENVVRHPDSDALVTLHDMHRAAVPGAGAQISAASTRRRREVDPASRLGQWLATMEAGIEAWRSGPAAPAERWDGSVASLELLGPWVLEAFGTTDPDTLHDGIPPDEAFLGACRYLGETLRRHGGGEWVYPEGAADRYDPYAGRPYLMRDDPENGELDGEVSVTVTVGGVVRKQDPTPVVRQVQRYLRNARPGQ